MPTQRQIFEALIDKQEPLLRQLFMEAIQDMRSEITLALVVDALRAGNIQGALDALNIERAAFGRFEMALLQTYNEGGIAQANLMRLRDPSGNKVSFRFGIRDLGAENWISRHVIELSTTMVREQHDNLRTVLLEGLQRGDNPNTTARNIVGRVSRATNERIGGLLGLSGPHMRAVEKARQAMLSGNPDAMRAYLALQRRDKRFDATIRKAIEAARSIPAEMVARITGRLSDRYLELRGQMIARTETLEAIASARHQATDDAIAQGKVEARLITKTWRRSPAEHPRLQHTLMSGTSVAYNEPFVLPDGTTMMHPHDPNAPARHTVGCKCIEEIKIDYIGQLVERQRAA